MKKYILFIFCTLCGLSTKAQMVVTDPTMQLQAALNQIENVQQAVQTYKSMENMRQSIQKGVETLEKINNKLTLVREVQDIVTRSGSCIKRIEALMKSIPEMKLGVETTTNLLGQCSYAARDCASITAYGSKLFTNNFFKMGDKDRLDETRKVLDDLDKLMSRINNISTQAHVVKFNAQMAGAYFK